MAGHAILPGCTTEWHHDCPGSQDMPDNPPGTPPDEIRMGGLICSCPCHPLQRAIARLTEEGARLFAEQRDVINQNARLAAELDETREQLRAAWLGNDD